MNARRAFVCGGQGARLSGLGAELLARSPELVRQADAFSAAAGRDIRALLHDTVEPGDTLSAHLALVSFALLAHAAESKKYGENTAVSSFRLLAGHSLGEISALACAGALSPEDALRLAAARGHALARACARGKGGMLALLGKPIAEMQDLVHSFIEDKSATDIWIANYNSPLQLVLSGEGKALAACAPYMEKAGLRAVTLPTAGAFHSPYMAGAAEEVFAFASRLDWQEPRGVCLSSMTGRALTGRGFAAHCALQIVSPVRWLEVMKGMRRAGITEIVEAGAGGTLGRFFRSVPEWRVRTLLCGAASIP